MILTPSDPPRTMFIVSSIAMGVRPLMVMLPSMLRGGSTLAPLSLN